MVLHRLTTKSSMPNPSKCYFVVMWDVYENIQWHYFLWALWWECAVHTYLKINFHNLTIPSHLINITLHRSTYTINLYREISVAIFVWHILEQVTQGTNGCLSLKGNPYIYSWYWIQIWYFESSCQISLSWGKMYRIICLSTHVN